MPTMGGSPPRLNLRLATITNTTQGSTAGGSSELLKTIQLPKNLKNLG